MAQKCLDNKKKKQLKKHDRQTEGHPDRQSQLLTIMTPMLSAEIEKQSGGSGSSNNNYIQCESKKNPPCGLWQFFQNGWEFFNQILHAYYTFLSMLDYEFLFNYLQL